MSYTHISGNYKRRIYKRESSLACAASVNGLVNGQKHLFKCIQANINDFFL